MPSVWKLSRVSWKQLCKQIYHDTSSGRITGQAAQLSFYFLLAIFPLLLFAISVFGLFLQFDVVLHQALKTYLRKVVPESVFSLIDTTLTQITQSSDGGKISLGLIVTLWAASTGMLAVIDALNLAYGVKDFRPWWKQRLVAVGLTIAYVLLILLALLLLLYGPWLVDWLNAHLGLGRELTILWHLLKWLLVLGFVLLAFNILYIYAPNVKHRRWHWLMPGTVVGLVCWLLVSYGFKVYLTFFNSYSATYGSIGAVIIMLLWLYLSGIALLLGGEVNSIIEKSSGKIEEKRA